MELTANVRRGLLWLLQNQNEEGGWPETIHAKSETIEGAMEYLLSTMTEDGRWEDQQSTFTVFARTFYYQYPIFNYVLPLNAMTEYLKARDKFE